VIPARRSLARLALLVAAAAGLGACDDCSASRGAGDGAGNDGAADGAASASAREGGALEGGVVNETALPTASVAKLVNPANLPRYTGDTGSVEGTLAVTGDPPAPTPADFSRCPDAEKTWGAAYRTGEPVDGGPARALADAIVGVTGYEAFVPEKEEAQTLTIEGCAYTRRTVALTIGQRLDVKNDSNDFWTPLLEPAHTTVMRVATPHGDPVHIYPKKVGEYLLLDHDRKYAVVDVMALRYPFHAVTDLRGHYRIDGIPVGKVTLFATHPRIQGDTSKTIEIRPGLVQTVDLVLKHVKREAGAGSAARDSGLPPVH
jgi:hypothetical protein